ncbi:amino acid/amide ABC transporter substrate-binding protein (HAAT family) [Zavarzinia compransoris]|nr:amino acid/amide ABC transporter substrate-binding protein (HAAT family) [Zavarzinia compransoris]
MKMVKKGILGLVATLGLAAVTAPAVRAEEVVVGLLPALTGSAAPPYGVPAYRGMQVALDEIKDTNMLGDITLKVIVEDYGSDKAQAITLATRFAKLDRVSAIIGPIGTAHSSAVAPLVNEEKVPMMAMGVSETITAAGPWAFKNFELPAQTMMGIAHYSVDTLKTKRAALVFMRDGDGYVAWKNTVKEIFEKAGVEIVAEEGIVTAETNFTALATKLVALEPDLILLSTFPENGANVLLQARQAGLDAATRIIGGSSLSTPQYTKIGGEAVEGTYLPTEYLLASQAPANVHFVELYRKKFGNDPDQYAATGYTMMMVVANAIKTAGGGDREKIRNAMAATKDLPTPMGKGTFTFDEKNNPHYGSVLVRIENGELAEVK